MNIERIKELADYASYWQQKGSKVEVHRLVEIIELCAIGLAAQALLDRLQVPDSGIPLVLIASDDPLIVALREKLQ